MGNISSNTLFHFTTKIDYLKEILKNNFTPRISIETISVEDDEVSYAYPMKCFCDIPLSQVNNHMNIYGKYSIGLTKEWAIQNKISPVIYFCKDSPTITGIIELFELLNDTETSDEKKAKLFSLFLFAKQYEGKFYRNGSFLKNKVRFYNEREWRHIPEFKLLHKLNFEVFLTGKDCYEESKIKKTNDDISALDNLKLRFEPKDVKYIVVEREEEILEIVDVLRNSKRHYSFEDVQILTTRIITSRQIDEDF